MFKNRPPLLNFRAAQRCDIETVIRPAAASDMFKPPELEEVRGMLCAWLDGDLGKAHQWVVCEDEGIVGVAYFAPEQMSYRAWNLYMIAIGPARQGRGSKISGKNTCSWNTWGLRLGA